MSWSEIINIKGFPNIDAPQIIRAFYNLRFTQEEEGLGDMTLLRDQDAPNVFYIRLTWQGDMARAGRTALGRRLGEAFSNMGDIDHSVWVREASLFLRSGGGSEEEKEADSPQ